MSDDLVVQPDPFDFSKFQPGDRIIIEHHQICKLGGAQDYNKMIRSLTNALIRAKFRKWMMYRNEANQELVIEIEA